MTILKTAARETNYEMDLVEQHYAPLGAKVNDDDDEFYPYHLQCMLYNTYIFLFLFR